LCFLGMFCKSWFMSKGNTTSNLRNVLNIIEWVVTNIGRCQNCIYHASNLRICLMDEKMFKWYLELSYWANICVHIYIYVGHKHGKVCQLETLVVFWESIHKTYLNILSSWILFKYIFLRCKYEKVRIIVIQNEVTSTWKLDIN